MDNFKLQIVEDIKILQREYGSIDSRLLKDEFAFNYWVLSRIYSLDEDIVSPNITEYNDKNIDCFVHYEDAKELYIIQNKYYGALTSVKRDEASDFLTAPMSVLLRGTYKNRELQSIFDRIKDDSEYKIWLHFFVSNDKHNDDVDYLFDGYDYENDAVKASVYAKYFDINEIRNVYFDDRFTEKKDFKAIMPTYFKGTALGMRPEEYSMPWMVPFHYVMINVAELYAIYKKAVEKNYELFEENIREYLGTAGINNGIIKTLKDKEDRQNFFYYNNGITIICDECQTLYSDRLPREYKERNHNYGFELKNPQIVNGCQTINSIAEVLKGYSEGKVYSEFEKAYVLVKIYVLNSNISQNKSGLDVNIVKYTNSQNAITDKAFASKKNYFLNIQKEFLKRGFLLLVKPSDKHVFAQKFSDAAEFGKLKLKSKQFCERIDIEPVKASDYMIPLEKLLKVLLAFREDGFVAYKNGATVLKPNSLKYKNFSLNIEAWCSIDNMLLLYLVHDKAEKEKKKSDSKRFPIPYYVMSFIGSACKNKTPDELKRQLDYLFDSKESFLPVYNFYKELTSAYAENLSEYKQTEYNVMIKQEVETSIFENCFKNAIKFYPQKDKIINYVEYGK